MGKCTGFVDIALESLTELGLEKSEIGLMLALVHANLPADSAPAEESIVPPVTADGTTPES